MALLWRWILRDEEVRKHPALWALRSYRSCIHDTVSCHFLHAVGDQEMSFLKWKKFTFLLIWLCDLTDLWLTGLKVNVNTILFSKVLTVTFPGFPILTLLSILWSGLSCPHLAMVTLCPVGEGRPGGLWRGCWVCGSAPSPLPAPGCFSCLQSGVLWLSIWPTAFISLFFLFKSALLRPSLCPFYFWNWKKKNGACWQYLLFVCSFL